MHSSTAMNRTQRYDRQLLLKEIGETGQKKLQEAKVLVIGAGGLGCPALQYLAAAGVGSIGIVDFDIIDISNLHRQILYSVSDIGKSKAETASLKLNALNPEINIKVFNQQLMAKNALDIISEYDIVIDGSDNYATRYLVNDACAILNKPMVYGAVLKFEGQVGVFNIEEKATGLKTNYRDLFPTPPLPGTTQSCNEAGVLGVVCGIIGSMQAAEAIKIITGAGEVLSNEIVSYNLLTNSFYRFKISKVEESNLLAPQTKEELLNFNYDWFCGDENKVHEISVLEFEEFINGNNNTIIDIREFNESPQLLDFERLQLPWSNFESLLNSIEASPNIVVFCQSGKRSKLAVEILKDKFPDSKIFGLKGGIIAYEKNKHTVLN